MLLGLAWTFKNSCIFYRVKAIAISIYMLKSNKTRKLIISTYVLHQGRCTVYRTCILHFSTSFITVRVTEFWMFNLIQHGTQVLICSTCCASSCEAEFFSPCYEKWLEGGNKWWWQYKWTRNINTQTEDQLLEERLIYAIWSKNFLQLTSNP